jgi:type IV pilus assembly protein PilX
MSPLRTPQFGARRLQKGMALVTGLLLLVVVTILALSMFRSYGTQQKIAGNTREKQRALSAAISAQQYAEYWLSSNSPPPAGGCTGMGVTAVPVVCLDYPDFATVPWTMGGGPVGTTFNNFNSTAKVNSTAPTQGTYYTTPMFYVTDLGQLANGSNGEVYQIDATGWGGVSDTVAVVESTYSISPSGRGYDK